MPPKLNSQSSLHLTMTVAVAFALIVGLMNTQQATAQDTELQRAIELIKYVDMEGTGHEAAVIAQKVLNNADAKDVPQLLQAMEGANKLQLNWLRGGIQSALNKGPLPREEILAYFKNREGSPMGRLMAFELLSEADQDFAASTVATMIDDPSLPLREMAIADFIKRAEKVEGPEAIGLLGFALTHAREVNQVNAIVKALGKHGVQVDTQKQLGFLNNWHLVGPFDHVEEKGFDVAFGPEKSLAKIDLTTEYADSKSGEPVRWKSYNSTDDSGTVDLNEAIGKEKGAIVYAFAEFDAVEETPVEIRIGCINGNKVWVNGEEVINNEIYHVGMMPDQFTGKAKLKKGKNEILFKVCQNEQTQPWAQDWMFQLRVCEADGKAVPQAKKPAQGM